MRTLTCWLMLATTVIPLHSVTVTANHHKQSPLSRNVPMSSDDSAHEALLGIGGDSYSDDQWSPKYGARTVPIETTWQVREAINAHERGHLEYDAKAKFPSELALDGLVSWHTTKMDFDGWVSVHYPDIKWQFNQQFLGWGFNQFQAWARTSFTVPNIQRQLHESEGDGLVSITIQCENIGDFYVNDERLSGDWYGYELTRHTLRLLPGSRHTLSVRVVHEVRIFGGVIIPPPSKFKVELRLPFPFGHDGTNGSYRPMVQVVKGNGGVVVMDAVDGTLAGKYISVALRNVGGNPVVVKSVKVIRGSRFLEVQLADQQTKKEGIHIFPSTHRPIAIRLSKRSGPWAKEYGGGEFTLEFEIETLLPDETGEQKGRIGFLTTVESLLIVSRKWGEPYIYTFRDFDGTVHYAAAIPPRNPESQPSSSAPVLVALHGAASIKNVMNAIDSLALSLPGVPEILKGLPGIKPDSSRLFIAGHSNGGQGAWFLATHFPDKAIAVTPAAGYVNIKQYVPFTGWLSNSYTDAHLRGILESSIIEFDNDVHMSNTVGLPILARTGSMDDNVPPFHSRKMVRLGQENAHNTTAIWLSEVPGQGHWFTGVLQDAAMLSFLNTHLYDNIITLPPTKDEDIKAVVLPPFPSSCVITVINPAGMGSKCGIQVEQLRIPFRKGTIKLEIVKGHDGGELPTWVLATTNIRRLSFADLPSTRFAKLVVDGTSIAFNKDIVSESVTLVRSEGRLSNTDQRWKISESDGWKQTERHRETYGPAIQVLEKRVVIVIGTHFDSTNVQFTKTVDRIAKLVAHDIYQYGRGDVEVLTDTEFLARHGDHSSAAEGERTNVVLIGDGHQNSATKLILGERSSAGTASIQLDTDSDSEGQDYRHPGTGLLMIRPWGPSNLAMVIAGLDPEGLETAARLFPKRTGLLVPDWVITGPEMAWKGAGGILAAGYWGNHWEYLPSMSA
ncbi:hypothetical protein BGZ95_012110 [Linnemannia exigua]|uniref:Peptidase S9 prolyl oligopeptidase catalytic domain-containing protein n=1 Tax=Linnemannia exigua TaxID=604196 RepID=A0AAD4D8Z1_9FUNG|nr:hypothetical protein BGZ95_012110 [Linnemannia exigua]